MVNRAKVDSIEIKDEEVEQQLNARIEQILAYFNNDYKNSKNIMDKLFLKPGIVLKKI